MFQSAEASVIFNKFTILHIGIDIGTHILLHVSGNLTLITAIGGHNYPQLAWF
jgi:hypothetical protein